MSLSKTKKKVSGKKPVSKKETPAPIATNKKIVKKQKEDKAKITDLFSTPLTGAQKSATAPIEAPAKRKTSVAINDSWDNKKKRIVFNSEAEFNAMAKDEDNIGKILVPSSAMEKSFFREVEVTDVGKTNTVLETQNELRNENTPEPAPQENMNTESPGTIRSHVRDTTARETVYLVNGEMVNEAELKKYIQESKIKKSSPYVFSIRNASDGAVDVELLNPDYAHQDILIESGNPSIVTYREMLRQFIACPAKIGQSYLSVRDLAHNASKKMLLSLIVHTKDANMTSVTIPIVICKDPYQFQEAVAVIDQEFILSTMTYIRFAIPPLTRVELCLFPSEEIDLAGLLLDKTAITEFTNPDTIKKLSAK